MAEQKVKPDLSPERAGDGLRACFAVCVKVYSVIIEHDFRR